MQASNISTKCLCSRLYCCTLSGYIFTSGKRLQTFVEEIATKSPLNVLYTQKKHSYEGKHMGNMPFALVSRSNFSIFQFLLANTNDNHSIQVFRTPFQPLTKSEGVFKMHQGSDCAVWERVRKTENQMVTNIDDWLLVAQSLQQPWTHASLLTWHLATLGFMVN